MESSSDAKAGPQTTQSSGTVEDASAQPASLPKILRSKLDPEADRSGASTPSYVRTAAEVADSAALLDQEPAEPEMSAKEAGETGFRRMTATPIPEVANTAAEVADTAAKLDKDTHVEAADSNHFDDPISPPAGDQVPLFAYECFSGPDEDLAVPEAHDDVPSEPRYSFDEEIAAVDMNDPTLERFPSNRDEIMDTVRKMETSLDADQTHFEAVPPSPVVGSAKDVDEAYGLSLSSSPLASPLAQRAAAGGRLGIPRVAHGSVGSDKAPIASLGVISEAEEKPTSNPQRAPSSGDRV